MTKRACPVCGVVPPHNRHYCSLKCKETAALEKVNPSAIAVYYTNNHSLRECAARFGVTIKVVSLCLKHKKVTPRTKRRRKCG